MARAPALKIGDLVIPDGFPAEIYRVASKYPQPGYVRLLPYQRTGHDLVLFKHKGRWTDGNRTYVAI